MNDFENEFELPMRNLLGTKINLLNFCHFQKQNENPRHVTCCNMINVEDIV